MKKKNKKVIIFDLDGVLINSRKNMEISWNKTRIKFNLKYNFNTYFKEIGKPFKDILVKIGVKEKFKEIEKNFRLESKKNFNKIKLYKNVIKTLNFLRLKKKITVGVFTSKDKLRTLIFLRKLKIKVDFVQCPQTGYKGKPHPDLLNKIIKERRLERKNCTYVGDTKIDLMSAKKAKINFILAKYGYKIGIKNYRHSINSITEIKNLIS